MSMAGKAPISLSKPLPKTFRASAGLIRQNILDLTDSGHGLLLGYAVNRCHH
jgi:hypothetical protein